MRNWRSSCINLASTAVALYHRSCIYHASSIAPSTTFMSTLGGSSLDQGPQLESLCFDTRGPSSILADFRPLFPGVLIVKVQRRVAEPSGEPSLVGPHLNSLPRLPPDHPLRLLVLYCPFIYERLVDFDGIIAKLPTIQHLCNTQALFPNPGVLDKTRRLATRQWRQIRRTQCEGSRPAL